MNEERTRQGSFEPLSDEQKAEIKALEALGDEDIDFSDSPEVLDWSGAVRGKYAGMQHSWRVVSEAEIARHEQLEAEERARRLQDGRAAGMNGSTDFAEVFARLARDDQREQTLVLGGVNVRLVRVPGGGAGRWDSHATTPETVVVWSGDFKVEFRENTLDLTAGQCCVVPVGADHRGTSQGGAEVVLFTQAQ